MQNTTPTLSLLAAKTITRVIVVSLLFFVVIAFPYVMVFQFTNNDIVLLGFFLFQLFLYVTFIDYVTDTLLEQVFGF